MQSKKLLAASQRLPVIEGFTPGPWLAGGASVFDDHYEQVAQAFGPVLGESAPNAHLIAAAPDLYRIAYEQREIIKRLIAAIGDEEAEEKAIAAAAPYLQD